MEEMNKSPIMGFSPAPLKREGDIADPDEFTWECNLDECEKCRAKYLNWKQKYTEQEAKRDRS